MTITRLQIRVWTSLFVLIGLILGAAQHASAQAQSRWYFAEGATGSTFELDLILANPTAAAAQVRITFLRGAGAPQIVEQELPANTRRTIRVNSIPGLEAEGTLSILVESLNGVPIMAERTMYWIGGAKRGGHNSTGVEAPRTLWYLAEGATGSFFTTYILIANPNPVAADVTVRYLKDNGVVEQTYNVQGNRRFTINVNTDVPGMSSANFGAQISSSQPILVERAMYWQGFEGGTDAMAVAAPSTTWMFAEGHTGSDFQTFFLLSNPNPAPTSATVTFYLESGAPVTKPVTVPANGRSTVYVNQYPEMVGLSFATTVTSSLPIVAERAIYWGGFVEGNATPGLTQGATKWAFSEGRVGTHEGQPFDTFFLLLNNSSSPLSVHGTFYLEDGTGSTYDFTIQPNSRYTLYAGTPPRMAGQAMAAFFEAPAPFIVERATYWGAGWFGGHGSTGIPWTGPIVTPPLQPRAATPTLSTPGGTYGQELSISLSTATAGAIIRYTTDGSEPTAASHQYFGGNLSINATTTIKAKAFAAGYTASYTATAMYTLKPAPPVLQHPAGSYPAPYEFGISTNVPGALIRYTTDGSTPNESSSVYTGPIAVNFTQTLTLTARVFKQGWAPSDAVSAVYQVTQGLLQTPTPTPAAGVYFEGQAVTLSAQPFVLIRYTTDGSDPTESSPIYSGQITVTTPLTLKARAFNTGYTPSSVLTARYDLKVRTPTVTPVTGIVSGSGVNASATTTTLGAIYRYTLDESEPTATSPQMFGGAFVQAGQTIVVRAFKEGWVTSDEGFATYEPEIQPQSAGEFSVSGVDLTGFNGTASSISFNLTGAAIDPSSVIIWRNGEEVSGGGAFVQSAAMVAGQVTQAITLPGLIDGRNNFEVLATDTGGLGVGTVATVWAGNRTATIRVMSASGSPLSGAQVQVTLLADERMVKTGTTDSNGYVSMPFLPTSYPFRVEAGAESYRADVATLAAGVTSLTLTLPRENLNFEAGTLGWTGTITLWEHSEAGYPLSPCPGCPVRNNLQEEAAAVTEVQTPQGAAQPVTSLSTTDMDLNLHTSQTPGRVASYRFVSGAGVRVVRARYRVQTGEMTAWPDGFFVQLRSLATGRTVIDQRTIAQLHNAGMLDVNRATGWLTLSLTLDNDREEVELEIGVSNYGDASYDTALWLDFIQQQVYEVSAFELHDYKNSTHTHLKAQGQLPLDFLSASPHSYYNGKTRVNGTIAIRAPQGATVTEIKLQVYYHEDLIAQAELVNALRPTLYQTIGATERLVLSNSQLMFEIDSSQFNALTLVTEANLFLQAVVTFSNGRTAVKPLGRDLIALKYYTATNRYPDRDPGNCIGLTAPFPCGGDDWARPLTVTFTGNAGGGFTWGDFSNMNGGPFPPHSTHQLGVDIDGYFNGYERRDAAVAQTIIGHLNTHGRKIDKVFVTFVEANGRPFYDAIKNVTLNDGRQAIRVIRPVPGHQGHFHWKLDLSRLP